MTSGEFDTDTIDTIEWCRTVVRLYDAYKEVEVSGILDSMKQPEKSKIKQQLLAASQNIIKQRLLESLKSLRDLCTEYHTKA